jgi:predicted PurR-regulated permease PerM
MTSDIPSSNEPVPTPAPNRPAQAETITTGVLVVATGIVVYLCYLIVLPFLPALAWALALAVIAHPAHRWLDQRMKYRSLCAGLTVVAITLLLLVPAGFVTHSLVDQATRYAGVVQQGITSGQWEEQLKSSPYIGPLITRLTELSRPADSESRDEKEKQPDAPQEEGSSSPATPNDADTNDSNKNDAAPGDNPPDMPQPAADQDPMTGEQSTEEQPADSAPAESGFSWSPFGLPSSSSVAQAAGAVTPRVGTLVSGVAWVVMQMLITMMCLFFFLRDRHIVLNGLKKQLPLSEPEADRILRRVNDTIYATLFGSLTVAFVQGCMGGLMFWILGLPSPLFWGAMMGLLAVVPMLGTFVVWAPTAVWLATQGDWTKAVILVLWGGIAIGLIDNLLYPYLVGNRMRFHTLLVFFAIVGGLMVFGAAGIILGPVLLAVADGLLQVWHRRIELARQT